MVKIGEVCYNRNQPDQGIGDQSAYRTDHYSHKREIDDPDISREVGQTIIHLPGAGDRSILAVWKRLRSLRMHPTPVGSSQTLIIPREGDGVNVHREICNKGSRISQSVPQWECHRARWPISDCDYDPDSGQLHVSGWVSLSRSGGIHEAIV